MSNEPSFAARWYAQKQRAATALDEVHANELASLSDEEALRRSDALLSMPMSVSEERRTSSGLAEQQALFARARR